MSMLLARMGFVLLAAPPIERVHLLDSLAQTLVARGHRVELLGLDPRHCEFWRTQGFRVREVKPQSGVPAGATAGLPLDELAEIDLRRRGLGSTHLSQRTAARLPLTAHAWSLRQVLGETEPDLVLFCDARTGMHRLIHFLASELGRATLHIGEGWLPGIMQVDPDGLGGDSSVCRRTAIDFRRTRPDRPLLDMTLAAWIGGAVRDPLADRYLHRPRLGRRLRANARALRERSMGISPRLAPSFSWIPLRPPAADRAPEFALPDGAPVAILLQDPTAPEVRLDSAVGITPFDLALATARALHGRSEPVRSMVIGRERLSKAQSQALTDLDAVLYDSACARSAATRALAVVTINHPAGLGALLAGTPTIALGRSPWQTAATTLERPLDTVGMALDRALAAETDSAQRKLRQQVLTRLLRESSVFCDPNWPDQNGIHGLGAAVERALAAARPVHGPGPGPGESADPGYTHGPAWPLEPA